MEDLMLIQHRYVKNVMMDGHKALIPKNVQIHSFQIAWNLFGVMK